MRILLWSEAFWPYLGGVETFSAEITRGLVRRGHNVEIIALERDPDLQDSTHFEGMPVHRLPMYQALRSKDPAQFFALQSTVSAIVARFKPDVIHANFQGGHIIFLHRNRSLLQIPLLLSLHSPVTESHVPGGSLLVAAITRADSITTCSESLRDDVIDITPEAAGNITVVHNGLAVPDIIPTTLPESPRFLCLGRMVKDKGFDLAVRAFAAIAGRFPDASLEFAGEGTAMPELRRLIADLGIQSQVIEHGWVENHKIPVLMNEVTAAMVPSRWKEPFGLVALEASFMARPVVATRSGGLPEVVVNGESGLLVDSEDVDGLARAMTTLLENPGLATRLGQAGRQRAINHFSVDRMVDKYETCYQNVLERRQATTR